MNYYIYTEVDSNDGDYVGSLRGIIPQTIPSIVKWVSGEELTDSEIEECGLYLPFIDNFPYSDSEIIRDGMVNKLKILTEIGIGDLLEELDDV